MSPEHSCICNLGKWAQWCFKIFQNFILSVNELSRTSTFPYQVLISKSINMYFWTESSFQNISFMVLVITFFITRVLWCVKRWQQHALTLLKKSHQIWGFVFLIIKSRWLVESLMNAFRPINYSADKISWFWQKSPVCYPQAFWEHILRELFIAVGWPIQLG